VYQFALYPQRNSENRKSKYVEWVPSGVPRTLRKASQYLATDPDAEGEGPPSLEGHQTSSPVILRHQVRDATLALLADAAVPCLSLASRPGCRMRAARGEAPDCLRSEDAMPPLALTEVMEQLFT
jgi:hypothetical protein